MRVLQPDLRKINRAGIRRWNPRIPSMVVRFFFTHYQNLSARLSGISAIVTDALGTSMLTIRTKPQYIAFVHGKELQHEQYRSSV